MENMMGAIIGIAIAVGMYFAFRAILGTEDRLDDDNYGNFFP